MKKQLQFLFGTILMGSVSVLAQPTITASGINPVVGDVLTQTSTTVAVSQGSAGANQTWNLAITGSTATNTIVAASSTTYSASFPNANVATGTSATAYYKTSATAWQMYGAQQGTVTISYSNPEDYLHYPFTYNNSYTDTWGSTFTNVGTTYYRSGHDTVTADGYGTLTTPAGTFSNVLRVHLIQNYQDSANLGGPFIIPYRNDQYMWFLNGNHSPIATTGTFVTSGFATNIANYLNNVAVGIDQKQAEDVSANLYPNPVLGNLNIDLNLAQELPVEIKILNTLGEQVNPTFVSNAMMGANHFTFDVSTLPKGAYFARINADGLLSTRRFVIAK